MTRNINDRIAQLHTDVFYFVLSRVGDYKDAEDITQTVIVKALSKVHMIRNEARLKSWVIKIASNEIKMYFRRIKKINSLLFNIEEVFVPDSSFDSDINTLENDILQHIISKSDEINICRAMEKLDNKYQTVLQLHLVCEFGFGKISEILNINVNSVKTRYYRGLNALKKEFLKLETGGEKHETE